jgi:hypothetical protein
MTKDELYALIGHTDVHEDMDVKLVVLDLIREQLDMDEITEIFWRHLGELDAEHLKGYFYRKRGG